MKTIALAHPITVNGKERSTIDLDFEALTVDAFTRADSRSHGGEGNVLTLMEANGTLHLNLAFEAAIAADQTLDITDLERLKGADIMKFAAAGRFYFAECNGLNGRNLRSAVREYGREYNDSPREIGKTPLIYFLRDYKEAVEDEQKRQKALEKKMKENRQGFAANRPRPRRH